jgi:predicted nucleotidyltransferase
MKQSIEIMKNRIVNILLNNKPSLYLYGSIVLEDFKIGWSDIDILCLTETKISDTQAKQLFILRQELLSEYGNNLYFRSFEGGFLTLDAFVNDVPDTVVYWGTRGQRITDKHYFDPFSMIELIEHGYLLYGNEVRDRFIYPTKEEIIEAVIKHYEAIRKFAVTTERSLYSAGWLLDIARCIYTLKTGEIISKTKAGKWVLDNNLTPDINIMERVIKIREEPNRHKDNNEVMKWLEALGKYIQRFADVLEKEISEAKLT